VAPELDPLIIVKKIMARASQEFVMDGVAAPDSAFIEKTGKVFGRSCIIRSGGSMLKNAAGARAPGSATDLGDEDAFPIRKFVLIARETKVIRLGSGFNEAPAVAVPFVMGLVILGGGSRNGRNDGGSGCIRFGRGTGIEDGEGR
jgi:hypothetical protein